MTTDLVRKQLETSLESSTLKSLQRELGADNPMLCLDLSGSMDARMMNGKTRIVGLREVLASIQGVPMIAFGGVETSEPRFVDRAGDSGGGTPLHAAIALAKTYGATRLVVISDGLPDDGPRAMDEAKSFRGKIDVVFVGDTDSAEGRLGSQFLDELARATGGQRIVGSLVETKAITGKVMLFLEGEVAPTTKTVFAGGVATQVEMAEQLGEEVALDEEDDDDSDEDCDESEEDDDDE